MEYTIQSLSTLAGVSTRTLRYYDEIGLLKPRRKSSNGYRIYGGLEIDRLHQILFYKSLGFELEKIDKIVNDADFNNLKAMEGHLTTLIGEQKRIAALINNLEMTIKSLKGEIKMSDKEKFECFKDNIIKENQEKYGNEVIEKYGEDTFKASNKKLKNATAEQWASVEALSLELNEILKKATIENDPASDNAQLACKMHKEWIKFFWASYSKEAHLGLCEMYTLDDRFRDYYEKIHPGCAEFLLKAMEIYLSQQ